MHKGRAQSGFTIVELLIVVVVIAILAAITIVAYNGIQNNARKSEAQANLNNTYKKVKTFALESGDQYPVSINACPTPGVQQLCIPTGNATVSYSVRNNVSPGSVCIDAVYQSVAYYIDDAGQVLPGSCSLKSCYEIQEAGGAHGSGLYWIQPTGAAAPMRAYCDMDTSGGGWTLLLNNVGHPSIWTASTNYTLNPDAPSLTTSYSMVQYADNIKADLSGKLSYRIDANNIGQLGGVWEAPFSATLEGATPQNVATLITKYTSPDWTYDSDPTNGTNSVSSVVPWYSSTHSGIVTWGGSGSWWGALTTNQTGYLPTTPYLSGLSPNPSAIRYWVK